MKAVLFHIAAKDEFRNWPADFPALKWGFAYSPAELEREIANAEILVLSNRAATPEAGEIVRKTAKCGSSDPIFFRRTIDGSICVDSTYPAALCSIANWQPRI